MRYFPIIGLEIHVQLDTKTKLFCSCNNESFGVNPNTNICPICSGQPGTLPVMNKEAVNYAIKAGLAMNCEINKYTKWDRKSYFYPDLPKGYQISQYDQPIDKDGFIEIFIEKLNPFKSFFPVKHQAIILEFHFLFRIKDLNCPEIL